MQYFSTAVYTTNVLDMREHLKSYWVHNTRNTMYKFQNG